MTQEIRRDKKLGKQLSTRQHHVQVDMCDVLVSGTCCIVLGTRCNGVLSSAPHRSLPTPTHTDATNTQQNVVVHGEELPDVRCELLLPPSAVLQLPTGASWPASMIQ